MGVGAVVFDGDRVLLVKRAYEPRKGEWSLLGGGVHAGETLEQADAREVKSGFECAIGIANFNDLKEGDVFEFFMVEKVAVQSL